MAACAFAFGATVVPAVAQNRPVNEKREVERVEKKKSKKDKAESEGLFVKITDCNVEFSIGEKSQTISAKRTVRPYSMSKFETTYGMWYEVRKWAEKNGYTFANPGQEGSNGGRGKTPSKAKQFEPVTNINWYDAIVWCNAYSEKAGRNPCYTYKGDVLRDATDAASCDLAKCDWNQNGYRLPSEAEWEYAARKTAKGLQSDLLASGQLDESKAATDYGWISDNSTNLQPVGKAKANGAGLYDMLGNVLEFCWDWEASYDAPQGEERQAGPEYGSERVMRGGSWNEYTMFYGAGDRYSFNPSEAYNYFGFRLAVTE